MGDVQLRSARSVSLILLVALAAGACGFAEFDDRRPSVDLAVTCAMWTDMEDSERIALADRMVDSPELLERIRKTQRQPEGALRDALILEVVGSVSKGCDVWAPPGQPVTEVVDEIYSR